MFVSLRSDEVATFTGLGGSFHVDWVATFTGIRTDITDKNFHGIRGTKARDTGHKLTGYGAHLTGYEARVSRDTGHTIDGIRGTGFTGYEAQKKW